MKKISTIIAVIMIVLSLFIIITARSYPESSNGVPGPGFFPTILGVLVIILSFSLLLTQRKEEDVPVKLFTKEQLPIYLSMGLIIIYLFAMKYLGFIITTPLFLIAIMKLFKVKKWWAIIITAI
ncbi:MAG: tripartite tricarboxylate transporter TctB family protein, partial [Sphaerochaetaceae bacterium]|nr:tripartite tricarboxylate transporter TctB family protein [Sphaerochaetaceae bacterium]